MRKIFTTIIMMFAVLSATSAAGESPLLCIRMTDGSQLAVALSDLPVITFEGELLVVKVGGEEKLTTALTSVTSTTYENSQTVSGITSLKADEAGERPSITDGDVVLTNIQEGQAVTIYGADGQIKARAKATAGGSVRISLGNMPHGVYILKTANHTFKIAR